MAANAVNAETSDNHDVERIGGASFIRISTAHLKSPTCDASKPMNVQNGLLLGSAHDQWLGTTYELKTLMKIRAHADGLRRVNLANRFVVSESFKSKEEVKPTSEKESDDDLSPVYFRHDRVLFQAKRHWIKGTVRRRISTSNLYDIRADNGNLYDAIPASTMEPLDDEMPYYFFTKGDRIVWVPDVNEDTPRKRRQRGNQDEEALTYKAKIVQVRSSNRFDLLLRTSRVIMNVPYEQLRPCAEADFASMTTYG